MAVYICGFDRIWIGNYYRGGPIGRAEVEVRVGKLENGKATGKDEIRRKRKETRGSHTGWKHGDRPSDTENPGSWYS